MSSDDNNDEDGRAKDQHHRHYPRPEHDRAGSASETTPLLAGGVQFHPELLRRHRNVVDVEENGLDGAEADLDSPLLSPVLMRDEAVKVLPLAWPVSLGYVVQMSLGLCAVFTLGRYSTEALAAMALTNLFVNVTGFSIAIGMASALDTLCSQAYGEYMAGRAPKSSIGIHLFRGLLVLALLSIPILVLWTFVEDLLLLAGQDKEIARLAGLFTWWWAPALYPCMVSEAIKRFLQCQGIMSAQLKVILFVSPINVLLQYVLVWSPYAIGPTGSPLALSISWILITVLLILYVLYIDGYDAIELPSLRTLLHPPSIYLFVKLGLPGVFLTCSEWWAFEIIALGSGMLGPAYLAAQTIILNLCSLTYVAQLGLAVAATTRIGNAIGAGWPNRARVSAASALAMACVVAVANSLGVFFLRDQWAALWTDDPNVISLVSSVLPLAALFQISDGIGAISGGILRGVGRQHLGAYLNLIGYYVIGLPLGLYLCFRLGWQLEGLWAGPTLALMAISVLLLVIIRMMDWEKEVELAKERADVERHIDHAEP